MIINKFLQIFSEEYLNNKAINKLLEFTQKTFPTDGTDKIFIGCVLIMFDRSLIGPAACREYLLSIVQSGKEKVGDTNLLEFYVERVNTNKMVAKYLKNIKNDLEFDKHIDLVIEYLEHFTYDFKEYVREIYDRKIGK